MIDFTRKKSPLAQALNNFELQNNNDGGSSAKKKKNVRVKSGEQVFDLSRDGESSFERQVE